MKTRYYLAATTFLVAFGIAFGLKAAFMFATLIIGAGIIVMAALVAKSLEVFDGTTNS